MRAIRGITLSVVVVLCASAGVASAQSVCVVLDETRDTLRPEEQRAALSVALTAFQKAGITVAAPGAPCDETYYLFNVRLGESVQATIHGPRGTRDMQARKIDELPAVYSQMVNSLWTGQPLTNSSDNVDRTNVTTEQTAPKRVGAESLKYVRLGYGFVTASGEFSNGPGFGIGYRYELDQIAIDGSLNLIVADENDDNFGVSGSLIKLMALHFSQPLANSSTFYGGGISWGGAAVNVDGTTYSATGLQGELTLGYELLRASTIRMFGELHVTLPFYKSDADFGGTGDRYTPSFMLSVGGGYGKNRTVRVIHD